LTGSALEMLPTLAEHMDVNALFLSNAGKELATEAQRLAVENVKRVVLKDEDWRNESSQGIGYISCFQEIKTTWHPIEQIGGATSNY
jgi:hypothetical protein